MVWELRDVVTALIPDWGVENTLRCLLGSRAQPLQSEDELMRRMCEDWGVHSGCDESTSAAFLDLFVTMAYDHAMQKTPGRKVETYLSLAKEQAARLVAQNVEYSKSRLYLRWAVAKFAAPDLWDRCRFDNILFRGYKRGDIVTILTYPGKFLLRYTPVEDETLEWRPRYQEFQGNAMSLLKLAHEAASETGDVEMQVVCLQEMVYFLHEAPDEIVGRLQRLLEDAGQMRAACNLCMFKYMMSQTPATRVKLREDLVRLGETDLAPEPTVARHMILRSLATNPSEKTYHLRLAQGHIRGQNLQMRELDDQEKAFMRGQAVSGVPNHSASNNADPETPGRGILHSPHPYERGLHGNAPQKVSFDKCRRTASEEQADDLWDEGGRPTGSFGDESHPERPEQVKVQMTNVAMMRSATPTDNKAQLAKPQREMEHVEVERDSPLTTAPMTAPEDLGLHNSVPNDIDAEDERKTPYLEDYESSSGREAPRSWTRPEDSGEFETPTPPRARPLPKQRH